jgi:acetoin utilization deacetylase AcuC-like enzyme
MQCAVNGRRRAVSGQRCAVGVLLIASDILWDMHIYLHPAMMDHDTGPIHPERPDRLRPLWTDLEAAAACGGVEMVQAREAAVEEIALLHSPRYVEEVREASQIGRGVLHSADNPVSPGTFRAALLAAGAALQAVDDVMEGRARNAFCVVRPPGHHSRRARAMGFCFFNNIALAAQHLRTKWNLKKIAILDWDAHHGNGTQEFFYSTSEVLFISLHGEPSLTWPGTGFAEERGEGEGLGFNLNLPMPGDVSDTEYQRVFMEQALPAVEAYRPEFLLVSCGFDPHREDPLVPNMSLGDETFTRMMDDTSALAKRFCLGRLVVMFEGGYNPEVVRRLGMEVVYRMGDV